MAYSHSQQIGTSDLLRGLLNPSRWLIHSGDCTSKRHSPVTQITPENVARLAPVWMFETGLGSSRPSKQARPLTRLNHRAMRSLDISSDGKRIVFDRSRDNSDIVFIDVPRREQR